MAGTPALAAPQRRAGNWLLTHRWGLALAGLASVTVLSRWPFFPRYPFNGDSVNYLLALDHFDLAAMQPHPPGNPLYVVLGKAVHLLVADPHQALLWLSAGLAALAVVLTAWLGRLLWDPAAGLWGALLLTVNPLFWLYSTVALAYSAEAVAGVLVGLAVVACWRWPGRRSALGLGAATAVATGLRPTVVLLLWGLLGWGLVPLRWRDRLLAVASGGLLAALWAVPLVWLSGGPRTYWRLLRGITASAPAHTTVLHGISPAWLVNLGQLAAALLIGLGPQLAVLGLLGWRARPRVTASRFLRWYAALWTVPPLLFFALVHLGQWGYLLLVLPIAVVVLAQATRATLRLATVRQQVAAFGLTAGMLSLLALLLLRLAVQEHDRTWEALLATLNRFPSGQTLVLTPNDTAPVRLLSLLAPQVLTVGVVRDDADRPIGFGVGTTGGNLYRLAVDPATPAQVRLVPYATVTRPLPLPRRFCPAATVLVVLDPDLQAHLTDPAAWSTISLPGDEPVRWRHIASGTCVAIDQGQVGVTLP